MMLKFGVRTGWKRKLITAPLAFSLALCLGTTAAQVAPDPPLPVPPEGGRVSPLDSGSTAKAPAQPSAEEIAGLVKELGRESYLERQKAQKKLLDLGKYHPRPIMEQIAPLYYGATDADLRYRLRMTLWNLTRYDLNERPIGFVGIQMRTASVTDKNGRWRQAVRVQMVLEGTAAERNGVQPGDYILKVDDVDLSGAGIPSLTFQEYIVSHTIGDEVNLEMIRNGKPMTMKLKLGEWNEEKYGISSHVLDRLQVSFNTFMREQAQKLGLTPEAKENTADPLSRPRVPPPTRGPGTK